MANDIKLQKNKCENFEDFWVIPEVASKLKVSILPVELVVVVQKRKRSSKVKDNKKMWRLSVSETVNKINIIFRGSETYTLWMVGWIDSAVAAAAVGAAEYLRDSLLIYPSGGARSVPLQYKDNEHFCYSSGIKQIVFIQTLA